MYETIRIVGKLKPKYVIWENVKNLLSKKHRHNFDNYLDKMTELGYRNYYQVLNAKDYNIPQNRERVFTISIRTDIEKEFKFPEKEELKLRLKDMLEEQVDEKYYLSDKGIKYVEKRDGGYTQIATEQTEIAHCPITAKGNDNWTGNFIKQTRLGGIYDTETKRHQAGSIWDKEGLAPTIETMQGGNRQPIIIANAEEKILIKNNTKQGFDIATDGDSVNLQQPNSKTRRGRVGHQVSQTIQTTNTMGVVQLKRGYPIEFKTEENYTNQIDILGNYSKSNYCGTPIVNKNGIAPTVRENHGQVSAVSENYRTKNKRILKLAENLPQDKGTYFMDIYNQKILKDETATLKAGMDWQQGNIVSNELRIRKLTPKECWRLMRIQ